jgi:pimeloyl-ACP methyl ester carboxylesterase
MSDLPPDLAAWMSRGRMMRVFGRDVFVVVEGPDDAEPILLLHGFPSSSYDFHLALPVLAASRRVVVHDHLGFGLSEKPREYSYSLVEQAEVAIGVWRSLGIERGHIVAHDYGTSVATEILARRARGLCPVDAASVTLSNGSVHIDLASLTSSQKILRRPVLGRIFATLSNPVVFRAQIRRILGDARAVSDEELDMMWAGVARSEGRLRMPQLASYMEERKRFEHRWIGALTALDVPAHVLWGKRDPVAVPEIATLLAGEIPGARLTWLEELGHYPMLEAPARWAEAVSAFVDEVASRNR